MWSRFPFALQKKNSYQMDLESVNNLESNGHTLNGSAQNGVSQTNIVAVKLNKTDQDIVRLIGQYLKIVGLG